MEQELHTTPEYQSSHPDFCGVSFAWCVSFAQSCICQCLSVFLSSFWSLYYLSFCIPFWYLQSFCTKHVYQYPERGHIYSARSLKKQNIVKRRFNQWWSTISPISTNRTINHLSAQLIEQVKEIAINYVRNSCSGTGTGT